MTDGIGPRTGTALPTRRVLAVGLVALALVAAGCLGGGGGGTTTEAATETTEEAIETTEEATPEATTTTEATTTAEATTAGEMTTGTAGETTTGGDGNTTLQVIVENSSGAPVPNATVEVAEEGGGVLDGVFGDDATDPGAVGPNGGVTVTLADGNYTITATAEGYIPGVANVSINGTDANLTLTLDAGLPATPVTDTPLGNVTPVTPPGNATQIDRGNRTPVGVENQYLLNITVEDASGAPVPNATVEGADEGGVLSSLFGDGQGAGSVNSQGVVSVEVANGTYTVSASAPGFADGQRDVDVNGSAANVTVTLNRTTTSG